MSQTRSGSFRRRSVLLFGLAAVVASTAGCTDSGNARVLDGKPPSEVLESARGLRAAYDSLLDASPDLTEVLTPLRDNHQAHVELLTRLLGQDDVEASPEDDWTVDSTSALRDLESTHFNSARDSCVAAVDEFAVALGEIAACRASHSDFLETL